MSEDEADYRSEIRARRLAVVDDCNAERIIAEVANGQAEVRLELSQQGQPLTGAVLYAAPDGGDMDLGPMLGLQLWADGNAYVEINLSKEDGRWVPRIHSADPNEDSGPTGQQPGTGGRPGEASRGEGRQRRLAHDR
jgi:hypothetical protein